MGTSAELAGLGGSAGSLSELGAAMNTTLGQLRNDVEMTQSAWAGAAQVAFQKVMADWDASSVKLNTALNDIGDMLTQNTNHYRSSESENEQSLLGLGGTLTV